ncbi:hypothetical protein [Janthinobacterium sp. RB2R34]|uniref:hypothetical protein n=1 Tax=Janthinobacterium sp. RB2R34 TaxID=3424193 RepID=UPI003F24D62F
MGYPFAHHFRMLRSGHGRHGHQVFQLRGVAVVAFHKTAQMLGSVVDDKLAASDLIMRRYWQLRRLLRDDYRIIALQCNIRGLIVQQNHVSGMTARKKTANLERLAWRHAKSAATTGKYLLLVVDAHQHANKFARDLTMMLI